MNATALAAARSTPGWDGSTFDDKPESFGW